MTTQEMLDRLVENLGRPADDDFYDYPDEHYRALTEAQQYYYRMIALKRPELLYTENTVPAGDTSGTYYDLGYGALTGQHYGKLRVFTPPGVRTGEELYPAAPGTVRRGFFQEGTKLYMTIPRVYTPGLYVLWIPAPGPVIDADTEPDLPEYAHDCVHLRAAGIMAAKPGSLLIPQEFHDRANTYWRGDPQDPSDSGVLGILVHQRFHQGLVAQDADDRAWWRNIPGGAG